MNTTDLNNQFQALVNGNHIKRISGTLRNERMKIATEVIGQNPEELKVRIRNNEIVLKANYSRAGNLNCYFGEIPVSLYQELFAGFAIPKVSPEAYLLINADMSAQMSTNSKGKFYQVIKNSDIEIV